MSDKAANPVTGIGDIRSIVGSHTPGDRERYDRDYGRGGQDYICNYGRGFQGDYGSYGSSSSRNRGRYSSLGPRLPAV